MKSKGTFRRPRQPSRRLIICNHSLRRRHLTRNGKIARTTAESPLQTNEKQASQIKVRRSFHELMKKIEAEEKENQAKLEAEKKEQQAARLKVYATTAKNSYTLLNSATSYIGAAAKALLTSSTGRIRSPSPIGDPNQIDDRNQISVRISKSRIVESENSLRYTSEGEFAKDEPRRCI